jgi:hypothetical protein
MIRNFIIFLIVVFSANAGLALSAKSQPAIVDHRPVATATQKHVSPRSQKAKGEMRPLPQELLGKPIKLTGACSKVKVIEWRGSKLSKGAIKSIDETCNQAVKGFKPFMKRQYGYHIKGDLSKFDADLCLLPLNSDLRSMNDTDYRFYYRSLKVDLWGYFQRAADNIYIRSDVFTEGHENDEFVMTLAHELFHAMSYQYKIFHQHGGDKDQVEEAMADQFTEYLGLGS